MRLQQEQEIFATFPCLGRAQEATPHFPCLGCAQEARPIFLVSATLRSHFPFPFHPLFLRTRTSTPARCTRSGASKRPSRPITANSSPTSSMATTMTRSAAAVISLRCPWPMWSFSTRWCAGGCCACNTGPSPRFSTQPVCACLTMSPSPPTLRVRCTRTGPSRRPKTCARSCGASTWPAATPLGTLAPQHGTSSFLAL